MKVSVSILDCENRIDSVMKLNETGASYIHVDVMDGMFVPSVQFNDLDEIKKINEVSKYPLDIHLMVDDPIIFIEKLSGMNIEFITVHLELDKDINKLIKRIHELGYKVGISLKPNTDLKGITPYLLDIDMVLLMSVEPGLGGQKFMISTVERIKLIKELIACSGRDIVIEVDGGINDETIVKIEDIDIAVVGSYVVKSDNYSKRISNLLNVLNNK